MLYLIASPKGMRPDARERVSQDGRADCPLPKAHRAEWCALSQPKIRRRRRTRSERRVRRWLPVFRGPPSADPNGARHLLPSRLLAVKTAGRCSLLGRAVWHPKSGIDPNLPAGLGHARDEPLRSQFTKRQTRHFEAANKSAAAAGNFAPVDHARRAGVTRQLREGSIVFFRL